MSSDRTDSLAPTTDPSSSPIRTHAYAYRAGKFQACYPVPGGYLYADGTRTGVGDTPHAHTLALTSARQLNTHKIKLSSEFLANLTGIPKYRWKGLSKTEKVRIRTLLEKLYPQLDTIFEEFQARLYREYEELIEIEPGTR